MASIFVWTRVTGDAIADAMWNATYNGVKQFAMSAAALTEKVKLTCALTGTSPDCGTVYVDGNMNLIHAPAEVDVEDPPASRKQFIACEAGGERISAER